MRDFVKSDKGKCLYWIIGIIEAIVFAFVTLPPLYATWNKIDPLICGFPFSVAMMFIFLLILAVGLVLIYQVQKVRGEL